VLGKKRRKEEKKQREEKQTCISQLLVTAIMKIMAISCMLSMVKKQLQHAQPHLLPNIKLTNFGNV